jgi:hypothetical protein
MSFDLIDRKFGQQREAKKAPEPVCDSCEGGGWECYGLGFGDPHFRECSKCGNPNGEPCP